jgi:hypothetical protein
MSNLDGVNFFGSKQSLSYTVQDSLIAFLNHGFLELGAYISYPVASGNLVPLNNLTGVVNNTIYYGNRNNWVYETDFVRKDGVSQYPPVLSGVIVNGSFVATGSTYHIDYPRGRVVFNAATTGSVQLPYTIKYVGVYRKESDEYRKLMYDLTNPSYATGSLLEPKAYLPAVFVDLESYETVRGTALGTRSKLINYDISLHIFATDDSVRNQIQDICYFLETKQIPILNFASGYKPLNYRGEFTQPSGLWSVMNNNYRIGYARFDENARVDKKLDAHLPLKYSKVTLGLEFDAVPI